MKEYNEQLEKELRELSLEHKYEQKKVSDMLICKFKKI